MSSFEEAVNHGWSSADAKAEEDEWLDEAIAEGRYYLVGNGHGIPFRSQIPMTEVECKAWIEHDVAECHKIGLFGITERDYDVIDIRRWRK